jgi:hypothetical protein
MGWRGLAASACPGRETTCEVWMGVDQTVFAEFRNTYLLILPAIQLLLE